MSNKQIIDWSLAMHPLLELKFAKHNTKHPDKEPRKVVPLDIKLTLSEECFAMFATRFRLWQPFRALS